MKRAPASTIATIVGPCARELEEAAAQHVARAEAARLLVADQDVAGANGDADRRADGRAEFNGTSSSVAVPSSRHSIVPARSRRSTTVASKTFSNPARLASDALLGMIEHLVRRAAGDHAAVCR